MTVQTTLSSSVLNLHPLLTGGSLTLAFLLLPFSAKLHRRAGVWSFLRLGLFIVFSLGAVTIVTGCGTGSGFFGKPQQTYTIQVLGTATTLTGTIQHATFVTLTVQ